MSFEPEYIMTQSDGIEIMACQAVLEDADCAYYLRIENNSVEKIKLLGQNFCITDCHGNNFYKDETGFKGELPELSPGEYFEYAAKAPANLAHAVLYGSCRVTRGASQTVQNIKIPTLMFETFDRASSEETRKNLFN